MLKIAVVNNLTVVPKEPLQISAYTLYHKKVESLAYISAGNSMGLSSLKFLWWDPKDACFLQYSA